MVIDETADIPEAARNTRISKTNDNGSGCSADGNLLVDSTIYDAFVEALLREGGYLVNEREKELLRAAYWDSEGRRTAGTIARPATVVAERAGFALPPDKTFFVVPEQHIGKEHLFSTEKLGTVLAVFKYHGFDDALDKVRRIFDTGGKGHSCGIYSFNDDHIHALALTAPVSRIMVRQIQSRANAGTFTNGMPMTSSMGCGVWGGNITNENISLKHYMNVTWVSRPIPEDRPSDRELFGDFYDSEIFEPVARTHP
jgi:sulfoacetaldehyde dehydrogenase